jgi:N-acetylglucosaminyldiphosphoundecaprenol N-acetyl-beta-D-mannosaminyltransferase
MRRTLTRIHLLGCPIDVVTLSDVLDRVTSWARAAGRPRLIHTVNVDHLVLACRDDQFAALVRRADLVVADGMPLVWASRWQGTPLPERVAGVDLAEAFCKESKSRGLRVFFLGGASGIAEQARQQMLSRYPDAQIVGIAAPSGDALASARANAELVAAINSSDANTLLIAFGAPKQEAWFHQHRDVLKTAVNIGVGGTLDLLSGTKPRAPSWMRTAGLEWLFRLRQEPGRLWKRYLVRDPSFLWYLARDQLRSSR